MVKILGKSKRIRHQASAASQSCHLLMVLICSLVFGFCLAELYAMTKLQAVARKSQIHGNNTKHHQRHKLDYAWNNQSIASKLYEEVRVLCWIMTYPENHKTKAIHVKGTWGKRCNKLLFMSSTSDHELGAIALPVIETRDNLWAKTKEAFKYIHAHHMNDADWFLKADDDTYTIMENLRHMLSPYKPEIPYYFGCRFKEIVKQGYMSGGAGYVLSKEAVRRFVENGIPNPDFCSQNNTGAEDVEIAICLHSLNVTVGDSRDIQGRGRFFPFPPEDHLIPYHGKDFWYWQWLYYKSDEGLDCCSDNAISFHYVSPYRMYFLNYLIYRLRPFGIVNIPENISHVIQLTPLEATGVATSIG